MLINEVFDSIVKKISKKSKFSEEEIAKTLEKSVDTRRPNCTLFLMKISQNAQADADELYRELSTANIIEIENILMRGPSICFDVNKKLMYKRIFTAILKEGDKYGSCNIGRGKNIVVEFSSPNIAKVFHVGHLRTTILGSFIVNLYKTCGYNTTSINYLGDWGKQFGMVLLGYNKYGDKNELKANPLKHLFDMYVKINKEAADNPDIDSEAREIFRQMEEERNEEYLGIWSEFRAMSIKKYRCLYEKINIRFDVYSGESFYNEKGRNLVNSLTFKKIDEDGSVILDLGKLGNAIVVKKDGTTLYLTRDLAAAVDRFNEYKPEKIIYVVSNEQNMYFEQLFEALRLMGYDKRKLLHVNFGLVKGMSTRKGKVEFLEDIITTATEVMKKEILSNEKKAAIICDIDATALTLAVSTLVIMDFTAKRIKGYEFDIEKRAKNVSGTGTYLQYAHCRLKSIESKNENVNIRDINSIIWELVDCPMILNFSYKLLWYQYCVFKCLDDHEPSRIVTYLQDLAGNINYLVDNLQVKDAEKELARARLAVLSAARFVLHNGLRLLGIIPLNQM